MSKEEKVINSKGKGKGDCEGPHGVKPDLSMQLVELKKTFRSAQFDLIQLAGEELRCPECRHIQVLHADSNPQYNDDDGLIMFCTTNQCGYTSSLPSLGKDWECLWEEEIDGDKLSDSQDTFWNGLITIEEINTEIVKLKYKVPALPRSGAPPTPLNNLISRESINISKDWKEVKPTNRNPFKKVQCNNDTVKAVFLGNARKIDTHPRNSKFGESPNFSRGDNKENCSEQPERRKWRDRSRSRDRELRNELAASLLEKEEPKDTSKSELAMVQWGDDHQSENAMDIETKTPPPRAKRQFEEVNGTSSSSGGKSRKKVAKDVASPAIVVRDGDEVGRVKATRAADQIPSQKEFEAILAENTLMKGQIEQLIRTVSRLEKLLLVERKEPPANSAREKQCGRGKNGASGKGSEVDSRGGKGSSKGGGDSSKGDPHNVNGAGQGGEDSSKGEGERKGDKGERGEGGSMHPPTQSYAAATAKPPAEGEARIKRERLRALHLFAAPEKVKTPPKEWGVINLKLNLSEKMRKGTTSKEIHHHATRMLEQLKIRKLVTEVSLRGKTVVSLYCIKDNIQRIRVALAEAKVTIIDKTEPLPESPVVREAAVRRVAFLLKRYKFIPKLREVILQDLDCEELIKKSIEKSGVRNDSSN